MVGSVRSAARPSAPGNVIVQHACPGPCRSYDESLISACSTVRWHAISAAGIGAVSHFIMMQPFMIGFIRDAGSFMHGAAQDVPIRSWGNLSASVPFDPIKCRPEALG